MKVIFPLLIFLSSALHASSQDKLKDILPVKNGKVTYSEVVKVDSLSKKEVYRRLRIWLAYNYEYIKLDNKELLISKGYFPYGDFIVWNTITIKITDGQCKFQISDFKMDSKGTETDLEGNYGTLSEKSDFRYINGKSIVLFLP